MRSGIPLLGIERAYDRGIGLSVEWTCVITAHADREVVIALGEVEWGIRLGTSVE